MQCTNHNNREATYACSYCGKLFCDYCLVDLNGKKYCDDHIKNAFDKAKKSTPYTYNYVKNSNLTNSDEINHTLTENNSSVPNIINSNKDCQ